MIEQPEREFIRCEDCHASAILRIRDGWKHTHAGKKQKYASLCLEHYEKRHFNIAQKWNHANGLDTEEKRKKYAFETPFSFKKVA